MSIPSLAITVQLGEVDSTFSRQISETTTIQHDPSFEIYFKIQKKIKIKIAINGNLYGIQETTTGHNYSASKSPIELVIDSGSYVIRGVVIYDASNPPLYPTLSGMISFSSSYPKPVPPIDYAGLPDVFPYNAENYIKTTMPLYETKTVNWTAGQELVTVQYFDGLGRIEETLQKGLTPDMKDVVTLQGYDYYGRESEKWLPSPIYDQDIPFDNGFIDPNYLQSNVMEVYEDSVPYTRVSYEPSPLDRQSAMQGTGMKWKQNTKAVNYSYYFNDTTTTCIKWKYIGAKFINAGTYKNGEVEIKETIDEDNNKTCEFTDKLGHKILSRKIDGEVNYDTYYLYDIFGNLRYVLPPAVPAGQINQISDDIDAISKYAYVYGYDGSNHCIKKRLPGCTWQFMTYDNAGQQILIQRSNSTCNFTIPDILGRPCVTGTCKGPLFIWSTGIPGIVVAERDNNATAYKGYNIKGITLTDPVITKVMYYDDYDFMGCNGIPSSTDTSFIYRQYDGFGNRYTDSAKGLLTGSINTILDDASSITSYIRTINYYDQKGELIQSTSDNQLGGMERTTTAYTFTGKIKLIRQEHTTKNKPYQCETYRYEYDHADRLIAENHKINSNMETTLASFVYNDLGHLSSKTLGNGETIKYKYNIRNFELSSSSNHFSEKLYYESGDDVYTPQKPCYNGNISAMLWNNTVNSEQQRGYDFSYDHLERLTEANYGESGNLSVNRTRYDEKMSYDVMGNMTSLYRNGLQDDHVYGTIDNLTYTYNGNHLQSVSDAADGPCYQGAFHFKDGSSTNVEYEYDRNGNMTKDLNKGISKIEYNLLNLPSKIIHKDGNMEQYTYSADGSKLSVTYGINITAIAVPMTKVMNNTSTSLLTGNSSKDNILDEQKRTVFYCGNVIYDRDTTRILTDEGYITFNGTNPVYHYYLKDHLGNNRIVMNADGTIEQASHYYPFGGLFGESTNSSAQPYKYNGKELDRTNGLDFYDYGARNYDAALAKWITVDPLCEKYVDTSPYVYCGNNPINAFDPDGRIIIFIDGTSESFKKNYNEAVSFLDKNDCNNFLSKIANDPDVTLYVGETQEKSSYFTSKDGNMAIYWNPNIGLSTTEGVVNLSPTTVLNHEADHAYEEIYNPKEKHERLNETSISYGNKEEEHVITGSEQKTAKALGEIKDGQVTRKDHSGFYFYTIGPTSNKEDFTKKGATTINEVIITSKRKRK